MQKIKVVSIKKMLHPFIAHKIHWISGILTVIIAISVTVMALQVGNESSSIRQEIEQLIT